MPRFQVAAQVGAVPPVPAARLVVETPLQELAAISPLPMHPVSTSGRVHWVCATAKRYPQFKMIIASSQKAESEEEGEGTGPRTFMLCKCSSVPTGMIALDSMVRILNADLRMAWRRPDGWCPKRPCFLRSVTESCPSIWRPRNANVVLSSLAALCRVREWAGVKPVWREAFYLKQEGRGSCTWVHQTQTISLRSLVWSAWYSYLSLRGLPLKRLLRAERSIQKGEGRGHFGKF